MGTFERLANKGEKKTTILKALDFLTHKLKRAVTKRDITDYLGESNTTLEYWFQTLKKEGAIDITGGGPGIPATISMVKKAEGPVTLQAGKGFVPRFVGDFPDNPNNRPKDRTTADCPDCGHALSRCTCNKEAAEIARESTRFKTEGELVDAEFFPDPPIHPCPHHPDREQAVGKNGKRLGVCSPCLRDRPSAKNLASGHDRKRAIQIYFHDKHMDLKAWLDKEAEANERTIQQEIIYHLKQAKARAE